jgi:Domain of unknown function (DUF4340)
VNKLNRILVGVLGLQLLLVLFVYLRGDDSGIGSLDPILPGLAGDKVERVRIFDRTTPDPNESAEDKAARAKQAGKPAIDLVKKGEAWALASHFDYPVEEQKVSDLIDKIEGMRSRAPIASGKARQRQLEVADDYFQRKVVLTIGGKETTFFVGSSAGQRQASVRIAGSDEVHGVTGLTAFGVGAQASAWVDTGYVDLQTDRIASFDVVNAKGSFHFERAADGKQWQASSGGQAIAPPAGMELNKGEIEKLVNRVGKIYLSEPADAKRAIDKPLATVTVRLKAEPPALGSDEEGEGEGAADAGAAESVSTAETAEERVIEIAASDKKDRYYVREKGRAQAVLVDALSITDLVEVSRDRLVQKIGEKKEPAEGEGGMEGMPPGMEGLPPGMEGLPPGMEGLPPGMAPAPDEQ